VDRSSPPYLRGAGTWLAFGLVLHFAFLQAALGAVLPYLRRELDIGYTAGSLHLTAFALGSVLAALASRRVQAVIGRGGLVLAGVGGMAAGVLGLAVAPTLAATLAASLLMGATGTWTVVGAHGSLADEHGQRRAIALAEAGAAGSFGALSVPLVVAAGETTGLGWRLAPAVGIAVGGLLAWRIRASGLREPLAGHDRDGAGSLPARGRVALMLVFSVVCAEWSVAFWGATFADDQVGLSAEAAVALSSAFFAAMLAGRLVVSVIARRLPAERLLAGALLLALIGFPLLWRAESALTAGAGLVLVGLGIASLFPLAAAVTIAVTPGRTTLATGRAFAAASAAVLSGPLILGQVADAHGLRFAFGLVPLFLVLAAAALATLGRLPAPRVVA
jgi:fucose permease